jgi:hypothetical protein
LLQGDEQQVDLYTIVTMAGPVEAGQELLAACTATTQNCTAGTAATVKGGAVISGTVTAVPPATVQLVAAPYLTGEPYSFTGTYLRDGSPADAPLRLKTEPEDVFACLTAPGGTGVTVFTCNPLKKVSTVTVKLLGPTGTLETGSNVEASLTVFNTSAWRFGEAGAGC